MFQFHKSWGLLGLLTLLPLASCQKMRSVSTLFAELNIGANELPTHADPQVKLTKIRYKAKDASNQVVAKTGIFLKAGKGIYEVACSDEEKQAQFIRALGFNADYVAYLRVEEEPDLVPTAVFACAQDPNPDLQSQYLFRYQANDVVYNFVKDYNNNRVYLLGCQALIAGFGFKASDAIEEGAFAELVPASNDKSLLYALSCENGKKINPDPLGFSETTLAAIGKLKTGLPSSESVAIPLTLADQNLAGVPHFELQNSADRPCDERLVWSELIGPQKSVLQVGSKPLIKPLSKNKDSDCALVLKARFDGEESQPLPVAIKIQPKKLQKVFADNGTFCMATDLGEIACKGNRKDSFPAIGSAPISMIIDFNYVCALYDPTKVQDNLKCKYDATIPERLTALQAKGQVKAMAGNQLFACAVAYDGKIEDKAQTFRCWATNVLAENQTGIIPPTVKLQGNTLVAGSQDNGICWDSTDVPTDQRRINCYNDRDFGNLVASGDPVKPNIKDMIGLGQLQALTDLQRAAAQAGGCVAYGEGKIKCWGKLDNQLGEKLKSVVIKAGTLHINGSRLCYQEKQGANPNLSRVQCYDGSTGVLETPALERANMIDYAIFRKLDRSAIRCDLAGADDPLLSCSDGYQRKIGDLFPEGRYWSQLITP